MLNEQGLSVESIMKTPAASGAPNGWVVMTPDDFSDITPDKDLTGFFNGGEPQWEAVVHPRLRRLQITDSLLDRTRRRIREGRAGIELVIGPTGEGKSTALRQAAAVLARDDGRTVLWRQRHDAVLTQQVLDAARDHGPGAVLVSDHAQLLLESLHKLVKGDHIPASSGLQLLLASRDTDWTRRVRELGFKINPVEAWKNKGPLISTKHPFGRVSESDARRIIQSWRALEPVEPDVIQGLSDGDAAKLLSERSAHASSRSGALLGGLLAVRYTPEELRAHLVDLLESLSQDVTPGDMTLADVVIVLSLVDVAGLDGIPSSVIAGFCDVEESSFRSKVANRLGREAVANYGDDIMRPRHPMVSEAVYGIAMSDESDLAVESAGFHLLEVIERLGGGGNLKDGAGQVFGIGRELYKAAVPRSLGPRSRLFGIALARRACELRPQALANHMALSECLRLDGQARRAVIDVWTPLAPLLLQKKKWLDWNKNSRTALNEFAITASLAGDEVEAAILRIAALSDEFRGNKVLEEGEASFSLAGLTLHLSRLYAEHREPWLAEALAKVHGCVLACFPYDDRAVKMAEDSLRDAGVRTRSFSAPGDFPETLDLTMARMSSFESDYLDIQEWNLHLNFTDLRKLLAESFEEGDA
ncbi:hypothetical protein [Saccharothrix sp. HUAS TT1]|uniref:P-loop NTPase n=1 Tax=unclassified Saccharothrix TaxID=2593673 RepID=UPI00345C02DA